MPHGGWMGADSRMEVMGIYQRKQMIEASKAYGTAHFTRVLGWSYEEYQVLVGEVRRETKDEGLKLYSDLYAIYGQKPLEK